MLTKMGGEEYLKSTQGDQLQTTERELQMYRKHIFGFLGILGTFFGSTAVTFFKTPKIFKCLKKDKNDFPYIKIYYIIIYIKLMDYRKHT